MYSLLEVGGVLDRLEKRPSNVVTILSRILWGLHRYY